MLDQRYSLMASGHPLILPGLSKMEHQGMADHSIAHRAEAQPQSKMLVQGFSFFYGPVQALFKIDIDIPDVKSPPSIGPSGCGKVHAASLHESPE